MTIDMDLYIFHVGHIGRRDVGPEAVAGPGRAL